MLDFPRQLDARERDLAERASRTLRWGLEEALPEVEQLAQAIGGELFIGLALPGREPDAARRPDASLGFRQFTGDLESRIRDELLRGRISVELLEVPSLTERRDGPAPELPPLPPPRKERPETFFDVRFVDEIGSAIGGVPVDLTADGKLHELTTNPAGVALLEGMLATSASVAATEKEGLQAFEAALAPRWKKRRAGRAAKVGNMTELVFEGGEIGPIAVKAALPNTVVIRPPLGRLFVQLFDKSGRVRLANRPYTIDGPEPLEGTTDPLGMFLHEEVFPGDYVLKLTLETVAGPETFSDSFEAPLVVLPAAASEPETRMLGVVPFSVLARLHLFFNLNKAFLLPTTFPGVKKLRALYLEHAKSPLLVVGHADTSGGVPFNDALSLDRAKATIAFLKDDVDAWLAFYGSGVPTPKRWGAAEDRMMLLTLPDFSTKPRGEDAVRWFQRTRSLTVDGKAGPQTRRQLVTEYMALDGASLADAGVQIEATAHGCGEHFPLDETGDELDQAPEDGKRDPGDRRVELFFFDPEFGIVPSPPSENSGPGSAEYPAWRASVVQTVDILADNEDLPIVTFVEVIDGLFRTNSAVVLPEAEAPTKDESQGESLTSVSLFATALRFNQEHAGKKVFVAGHCDTTNTVEFNQKLSEERARGVLSLLVGGDAQREIFKATCDARHQVSDYKQILAWVVRAFPDLGFDCDPGKIDDNAVTGVEPVRRFQAAYNRNKAALGATAADLAVDGDVGLLTWGAIFDCYEAALRDELGEDAAGVQALRAALVFVDDARKSLGFSELFPIEELGVDNFRSQANRRSEILFFENGEEPDLAAAEADPETAELYLPGRFERFPLEPMLSAKPWAASFDAVTADLGTPRTLQLTAPGLPAGEELLFTLQVNGEPLRLFDVISIDGGATLVYQDWDPPDEIDPVSLEAGGVFDPVLYDFIVEGGGRLATSSNRVTYADRIFVQLELDTADGDPPVVLVDESYVLQTPWGERQGQTDARGVVDEAGVPPGGASLLLRGRHLIHLGTLPHNWNTDA